MRYYLGANVSAGGSARIPTRAQKAESSSNFEISGPARLNVNTGIMLIVPRCAPAIGTFIIRRGFLAVFCGTHAGLYDLRRAYWRSRKGVSVFKSLIFFYDFGMPERDRERSSSRKAVPVRPSLFLLSLSVLYIIPNSSSTALYYSVHGINRNEYNLYTSSYRALKLSFPNYSLNLSR